MSLRISGWWFTPQPQVSDGSERRLWVFISSSLSCRRDRSGDLQASVMILTRQSWNWKSGIYVLSAAKYTLLSSYSYHCFFLSAVHTIQVSTLSLLHILTLVIRQGLLHLCTPKEDSKLRYHRNHRSHRSRRRDSSSGAARSASADVLTGTTLTSLYHSSSTKWNLLGLSAVSILPFESWSVWWCSRVFWKSNSSCSRCFYQIGAFESTSRRIWVEWDEDPDSQDPAGFNRNLSLLLTMTLNYSM